MENNLIIRDDLKTHIRSLTGTFTDDGFYVSIDAVLKTIDFAQTIDAEPVRRGEWLEAEKGVFPAYCGKCSECGVTRERENYCPNCGAKMNGGQKQNAVD